MLIYFDTYDMPCDGIKAPTEAADKCQQLKELRMRMRMIEFKDDGTKKVTLIPEILVGMVWYNRVV